MFNRFKQSTRRACLTKTRSLLLASLIAGGMAIPSAVFAQIYPPSTTYSIADGSPDSWTLTVVFQDDNGPHGFSDNIATILVPPSGFLPFNISVSYSNGAPYLSYVSVYFSQYPLNGYDYAFYYLDLSTLTGSGTTAIPYLFGNVTTIAGFPVPDPASVTVTRAAGLVTVVVTFGTPAPDPVALINDAITMIAALTPGQVTTVGNQNSLQIWLNNALNQTGNEAFWLNKAIERTDGCPLRGSPDGNGQGADWITDCAVQGTVYAALIAALNAL